MKLTGIVWFITGILWWLAIATKSESLLALAGMMTLFSLALLLGWLVFVISLLG